MDNAIIVVTSHAESNGLTSQQIGRLIDIIVLPEGLDKTNVGKLVGSLYPNAKVDEEIAVKIIATLGLGSERALLQTQASLLRWLVMIFPYLTSHKMLRQLYGTLFRYLSFVSLRHAAGILF